MNERDQFTQQQVQGMLGPDEQIVNMAFVQKTPSMWVLFFCGPIVWSLMEKKYYYAAVTSKRIILVETKMGFFSPKNENIGTEVIEFANVASTDTGGFLNNKTITFKFKDGTDRVLRIAPMTKTLSGQGEFLNVVPDLASKALSAGG